MAERADRIIDSGRFYPGMLIVVLALASLISLEVPRPFLGLHLPGAWEFLTIAWQVEAATLTLTAATVVFAFQVFAQQPRGLTLLDFARRSKLLLFLEFGSASLVLTGAVLLGYGSGAPGGSAGALAALLTFVPLAFLPVLFRRTIEALNPRYFEATREALLATEIDREVAQDFLVAIGRDLLRTFVSDRARAITHNPFRFGMVATGERVKAPRGGTVLDLDLRALEKLATLVSRDGGRRVQLLTDFGAQVDEGQVLLAYPQEAPVGAAALAGKVVKIA